MNVSPSRILLFPLFMILFWGTVWAQNSNAGAEGESGARVNIEEELTDLIQNFARDYVALPETRDKQTVMKYMDPSLTYSIFVLTISGQSRSQRGAYDNFDRYITSLTQTELETLKYEVSNIQVTHYGEQNGTLVYSVNYETKQADGIWVKGKETVTMALEKKAENWKVVFYNIVQVEDEKYKGTCLCEIFASQSEDGALVVKTTIPSGRSYTTSFDNFDFKVMDQGETLIRTKQHVFKRLDGGKLIAMKEGETIPLGVVKSKKEAVLTIIKEYLYEESCARLRVR